MIDRREGGRGEIFNKWGFLTFLVYLTYVKMWECGNLEIYPV
jgi:hypothetical protein